MQQCLVGEWVSVGATGGLFQAAAAASHGGEVLKAGGRVLDLDVSYTLQREISVWRVGDI